MFKDEEEEDSESPSRNRKPFERAFSEDNGVLNTEKWMRMSKKEVDDKSDVPIWESWIGGSGELLNEDQMQNLLAQSLE